MRDANTYLLAEFVGGPWDGDSGVYGADQRVVRVSSLYPSPVSSYMPDVYIGEYRRVEKCETVSISHAALNVVGRPPLHEIVPTMVGATVFLWCPND